MLSSLTPPDRIRLMKFVCSFAWADLEVRPEEKAFVRELVARLGLAPDEVVQVEEWLTVPPEPEGLDPTTVPHAHRQAFVDAIEGLIVSDGEVADDERVNLALFKQLLDG